MHVDVGRRAAEQIRWRRIAGVQEQVAADPASSRIRPEIGQAQDAGAVLEPRVQAVESLAVETAVRARDLTVQTRRARRTDHLDLAGGLARESDGALGKEQGLDGGEVEPGRFDPKLQPRPAAKDDGAVEHHGRPFGDERQAG